MALFICGSWYRGLVVILQKVVELFLSKFTAAVLKLPSRYRGITFGLAV